MEGRIEHATTPEERRARLQLARSPKIGPKRFASLIERFGSAERALRNSEFMRQRIDRDWRPATIDSIIAEGKGLKAVGGRFLLLGDPEYPMQLTHSATPPPVLSIIGDARWLNRQSVAIVGARNASAAGMQLAETMAQELGRHNLSVVSGLARGIDGAAHRGSLNTGTVAVLAGGIDRIFPAEHTKLAEALCAKGALISEMPLGTEPRSELFPRRNRIVAALAHAVVVVEAARRSGSLITARYALEEGRELCAVPGSPQDPRAAGPNQLLRAGAHFIESAEDVLSILPANHAVIQEPMLLSGFADLLPKRPDDDSDLPLEDDESAPARVLAALGSTPVTVDELCRRCHLSSIEVARLLAELELDGRLERHPGQYVSLR
jgi:DNA processing protein